MNLSDHPASLTSALARLAAKKIPVGSIISLGAGSGGDTLAIGRTWPEARILMVEAQADHEPALRGAARTRSGVEYVICAASDSDGEAEFLSASAVGGAVVSAGTRADSISVPSRRVDTLVAERRLPSPYFLKFDTHGVERAILDGAAETLRETSLIMMEVYNFKLNFVGGKNLLFYEMCAYLQTLGFRCADLCDPLYRPNDGVLWQMHMFFIRADHPVFGSNSYSAPALPR